MSNTVKVLESKKIQVKPIFPKNGRAFFKSGHDGELLFSKCHMTFALNRNPNTRTYVNPFDSNPDIAEKERKEFERLLNKKEGELGTSVKTSPFWSKELVQITKDGMILDLSNPIHALWYRILKTYPNQIRYSESGIRPSQKFELVDSELVIEEDNRLAHKKERAYDLFAEVKKTNTKLRNTLRLLDKKVPKNASKEAMKADIVKIIEQVEKTKGIPNIDDFIAVAEDSQADVKIFVLDAVDAGALKVFDGGFRITETNKLIGQSLQGAVDYFEDIKNQEEKLLIQEKINRANK